MWIIAHWAAWVLCLYTYCTYLQYTNVQLAPYMWWHVYSPECILYYYRYECIDHKRLWPLQMTYAHIRNGSNALFTHFLLLASAHSLTPKMRQMLASQGNGCKFALMHADAASMMHKFTWYVNVYPCAVGIPICPGLVAMLHYANLPNGIAEIRNTFQNFNSLRHFAENHKTANIYIYTYFYLVMPCENGALLSYGNFGIISHSVGYYTLYIAHGYVCTYVTVVWICNN